ncbi:MAG: uL22 family ribosomal protein [Candidatus Micrarchaeaceae archaeon]
MHKYSYTGSKEGVAFAMIENVDASYKDLGAVCDSIRYRNAGAALEELAKIAEGKKAVYYRRHNAGFGARHELGGKKGRFPMKAAKIVRRVLVNALANAKNKGYEPDTMAVVHAAANKTQILVRSPAKGVMFLGTGITGHTYGFSPARRSNLEYAKVEIALAEPDSIASERAKSLIKRYSLSAKKAGLPANKAAKAKAGKNEVKERRKPPEKPQQEQNQKDGNANIKKDNSEKAGQEKPINEPAAGATKKSD